MSTGREHTIDDAVETAAGDHPGAADAVVFDENGLHVAVVKNGVVHMQKISIARDFGTQVEVHDGVKPGDEVILNPMLSLTEGSRVSAHGPQTS